jgi:hypothetical protein
MSKRIALCIASRGNPQYLFDTLRSILSQCALPGTMTVVGLDEDDPTLMEARTVLDALGAKRIIVSIAPRADTIGAVYNRCAAAINADLYLNWADDAKIVTPGWDAQLSVAAESFPDNIGVIGFGEMPIPSALPACEAATRGLIDKMGYYLQDYTPYWWMDTWLYEIATMIGRILYIPIDIECLGPRQTRGMRDLAYWARFFDEMRVHRRAIAEAILSSPDFIIGAEQRRELHDGLDDMCATFERSNALLRDPDYARRLEASGYDAPEDERYRRAKDRSLRVLQELNSSQARVA